MKSLQKKPDWALGEKEGKTKSTSEAPPEAHEARFLLHEGICQSFTKIKNCICVIKFIAVFTLPDLL